MVIVTRYCIIFQNRNSKNDLYTSTIKFGKYWSYFKYKNIKVVLFKETPTIFWK